MQEELCDVLSLASILRVTEKYQGVLLHLHYWKVKIDNMLRHVVSVSTWL